MCWNRSLKRAKRALSMVLAVMLVLIAVLLFPAASCLACNSVGGGAVNPAFSIMAPAYSQPIVQQQVYAQQLQQPVFAQQVYSQQLVQPVYAQPILQQQVAYGGLGLALFAPRRAFVQRVVVQPQHHHH